MCTSKEMFFGLLIDPKEAEVKVVHATSSLKINKMAPYGLLTLQLTRGKNGFSFQIPLKSKLKKLVSVLEGGSTSPLSRSLQHERASVLVTGTGMRDPIPSRGCSGA